MFDTNNPIIKHKTGLLNLAQAFGNMSKAYKVMGVSRDTFYRYQELVEQGGTTPDQYCVMAMLRDMLSLFVN
ncbi:hypothetical protein NFHSH190041_16120 [Shewanella sp. NFH-SH190041]|nr:hypothetical protein NFHSH190041_16120 [Shewanella sp. NFH-SH190041]